MPTVTTNAATDPMIGRMIDQRYRVRSRIARGGMATVYLATDVRLERRVAIKIMHGHLADDAAFRSRFIQEARAAARLSHPNVVGVFDQGQEDDCTYIVMEYIPGITLRDLLREHQALTSEQALDILRAVLSGLAAAHRAGIVHRDLKPENVLLADDGRIKLGDFGLARAATANTATGAALLGTIAYLSPELVTRGVADTRSDIYAVGIMLYEMLTGEQPYKGEQPMQIAYQHANDTVPAPSLRNHAVPPALDELVLWATARDPEVRPRDARAMLEDLAGIEGRGDDPHARTAVLQSAPATAVLFGGRADASTGEHGSAHPDDRRPSPWRQTAESSAEHDTTVLGADPRDGDRRPSGHPAVAAWPTMHSATGAAATMSPATERLADRAAARRRRGWIMAAIVIAVALVAGGTSWWFGPGPGGNVRIPEVAGKTISQARTLLEARGLQADQATTMRYDTVIAPGQVAATKPSARAQVAKGTTVRLLVSNGPRMIALPSMVGQPLSSVEDSLRTHFSIDEPDYRFDADAPADAVLAATGTDEDGSTLDLTSVSTYGEQRAIQLTVSLGPVPDVVGATADDAVATLEAAGLTVAANRVEEYDEDAPAGQVLDTVITDDPVVTGSSVQLVVSKGPAPIVLPDVTDKPIARAASTLEALGLKVSYPDCTNVLCTFYDWESSLPVSSTDPAPGTTVHRGDTITFDYKQ